MVWMKDYNDAAYTAIGEAILQLVPKQAQHDFIAWILANRANEYDMVAKGLCEILRAWSRYSQQRDSDLRALAVDEGL